MKIVFFGDSITDAKRDRECENSLGNGYVKILSDKLKPIYPDKTIELINKGISGNLVSDLLKRVDEDVISLSPDVVVMMIGINDVLFNFSGDKEFNLEEFANDYKELVTKLKTTSAKLIILEPYLLPAPDKRRMRPLLNKELEVIKELGKEYADDYIAYDEVFNGLAESIFYVQYSLDGVHPTHRGARLIADTVIKAIRKYLN